MYRSVRRSVRCNRQTRKWVARTFPFFALTLAICFLTPRDASATSTTSAAPRAVQSGRGGGYQRPPQRRSRKPSIDARAGQLNLNEIQRLDLKKLLERQQAEIKRLWDDQEISPMDRMTKLRVLQEGTQKQFHALLTEEQRKKYDQLLQPASRQNPPPQENEKDVH